MRNREKNVYSFVVVLLVLAGCLGFSARAQTVPDLYQITGGVTHTQSEFHGFSVPKGGELVLADLKGPGKVTYFYITDNTGGNWYPGLVLKIFWDDAADPSIHVPLADFFGAIGGKSVDYQSGPMQVNKKCFMSYLPMPFSKRARFVLANDGDRDYNQQLAYGVDHEESAAFDKEKSRLHCEWRRSNPVKNGQHTMLEAQGRTELDAGDLGDAGQHAATGSHLADGGRRGLQ